MTTFFFLTQILRFIFIFLECYKKGSAVLRFTHSRGWCTSHVYNTCEWERLVRLRKQRRHSRWRVSIPFTGWARSGFSLSSKVANLTPPRFEDSLRLSVSSWLGSQPRVHFISSISFAITPPLLWIKRICESPLRAKYRISLYRCYVCLH